MYDLLQQQVHFNFYFELHITLHFMIMSLMRKEGVVVTKNSVTLGTF